MLPKLAELTVRRRKQAHTNNAEFDAQKGTLVQTSGKHTRLYKEVHWR